MPEKQSLSEHFAKDWQNFVEIEGEVANSSNSAMINQEEETFSLIVQKDLPISIQQFVADFYRGQGLFPKFVADVVHVQKNGPSMYDKKVTTKYVVITRSSRSKRVQVSVRCSTQ